MSGIPPMAGFMAKYLVFTAAIDNGYMWLALIGIVGSLIAVYYYFKVIIAMFGHESDEAPISITASQKFILVLCALGLIALSIFPNLVINQLG
jgi:NADH-quinone oxidoreductase subunit N